LKNIKQIITCIIMNYINEHLFLETNNFIDIVKEEFELNIYNIKILDYKLINDNLLFVITNNRMKYLIHSQWFDDNIRKLYYIKHNYIGMYSELSFRDIIIVK